MKNKHTPGPWKVTSVGDFAVVTLPPHSPRKKTYWQIPVGNDPESDANAHLVAAAPDLLEAAQIVKNYFEACQNRLDSSGVRSAITLLSNAIAKAEGKSA